MPICSSRFQVSSFRAISRHRYISSARPGVRARRITKPIAKFSCKMRVVAKPATISDLAERLVRAQQGATAEKMRGAIQAKRIDEFAAGGAALGKEFLNIAQ